MHPEGDEKDDVLLKGDLAEFMAFQRKQMATLEDCVKELKVNKVFKTYSIHYHCHKLLHTSILILRHDDILTAGPFNLHSLAR